MGSTLFACVAPDEPPRHASLMPPVNCTRPIKSPHAKQGRMTRAQHTPISPESSQRALGDAASVPALLSPGAA